MPWKFFSFLNKQTQHEPVGGEVDVLVFTDPKTGQKIEVPVKGRAVVEASNGAPHVINTHEERFLADGISVHDDGPTCMCQCEEIVKKDSTKQASNHNVRLCHGCRKEIVVDGKEVVLTIEEYESMKRWDKAKNVSKVIGNFFVDMEGEGDG